MNLIGKLLITLGTGIVAYALTMDLALPGSDLVNFGKLSDRQNFSIVGSAILLAGIILFATTRIRRNSDNSDATVTNDRKFSINKILENMRLSLDNRTIYKELKLDEIVARILTGLFVGICSGQVILLYWNLQLSEWMSTRTYIIFSLLFIIFTILYSLRNYPTKKILKRMHIANIFIFVLIIFVIKVHDAIIDSNLSPLQRAADKAHQDEVNERITRLLKETQDIPTPPK